MSVFRKLTVAENIQAVLELQNLTKAQIADASKGVARRTRHRAPARQHRDLPVRRRAPLLKIARALASDPRLILLDEPFAGVDPIAVIDIQKIIRFLKGKGNRRPDHRPQRPRETLGICDRAFIINAGEVLASHRPDEIVRMNRSVRFTLGEHFRL